LDVSHKLGKGFRDSSPTSREAKLEEEGFILGAEERYVHIRQVKGKEIS